MTFDEDLLEHVSFQLMPGEKAALIGANGTGKTTLVRDILRNDDPAIHIDENIRYACLSQLQEESLDEEKTVYETHAGCRIHDARRGATGAWRGTACQEECMDQKA